MCIKACSIIVERFPRYNFIFSEIYCIEKLIIYFTDIFNTINRISETYPIY